MSRRFQGAHEISVHELEGLIYGGVFGFPGVSQLMTFPDRTDVTVRNRTVTVSYTHLTLPTKA